MHLGSIDAHAQKCLGLEAVAVSPEDGLMNTAPLPSCLTLIWPLKPLTYLLPLPAENISVYRPAPLITTSPDLMRNKRPFLHGAESNQLERVTSMLGRQLQTEKGKLQLFPRCWLTPPC